MAGVQAVAVRVEPVRPVLAVVAARALGRDHDAIKERERLGHGRPVVGGRPASFVALEDKLCADAVWDAAGVARAA